MNELIWAAAGLLALLLVVLRTNKRRGILKMRIEELKTKLDNKEDVILLDVRTPEEYRSGHIPGSMLIPVSSIMAEAGSKLRNKDTEIVVYCASGARSASAARSLLGMGYTRVFNLGGIRNWPYGTVTGKQ